MSSVTLAWRNRIIPSTLNRADISADMKARPTTLRIVPDGDEPKALPSTHEETQLAESSILQNRRGTRYLMFDDAATIADVFSLRCRTSPNAPAYREFDGATKEWKGVGWREVGDRVSRMREGLRREGLMPGDRVAVMLKNSINWVVADQGAFAHGLVTVPLFVDDRPDNVAFILIDANVKLIVIDGEEHWKRIKTVRNN